MTEKWLGYARVSSPGQVLETQIDKINGYAKAKGINIKIYSEKVSALAQRDEMNKCIKELFEDPEIKGLIVTHLDRLGRTVAQLSMLFKEMELHNKQIICIDQAIDTTSPSGRLLYNLLASIAEFERELIKERLEAGRLRTKKYGGRPLKPLQRDEILRDYKMGASFGYLANKYHASTSTLMRRIKKWKGESQELIEGR